MLEFDTKYLFPYTEMGSSGEQRKWVTVDKSIIIKEQLINKYHWRDNMVEVIGSSICKQLNTQWLRHIDYKMCKIVDGDSITYGCCYDNIRNENYAEMYKVLMHNNYHGNIKGLDLLAAMMLSISNLQVTQGVEHLVALFLVDYLLCNTRRNLVNMGINFKTNPIQPIPAPIGDFGGGLFQGSYNQFIMPVHELLQGLVYEPFGCTFKQAMIMFMKHTGITRLVPKVLDITDLEFPSPEALQLFCIQCKSLCIMVKGASV